MSAAPGGHTACYYYEARTARFSMFSGTLLALRTLRETIATHRAVAVAGQSGGCASAAGFRIVTMTPG